MGWQYPRKRTAAQEARRQRRREKRAARRAELGIATPLPASPKIRRGLTFSALRARRKLVRESVAKFVARVWQNLEFQRLRPSRHARCPFQRVYQEKGRDVAGDPCGGKLQPIPRLDVPTWECRVCGRRWTLDQLRKQAA